MPITSSKAPADVFRSLYLFNQQFNTPKYSVWYHRKPAIIYIWKAQTTLFLAFLLLPFQLANTDRRLAIIVNTLTCLISFLSCSKYLITFRSSSDTFAGFLFAIKPRCWCRHNNHGNPLRIMKTLKYVTITTKNTHMKRSILERDCDTLGLIDTLLRQKHLQLHQFVHLVHVAEGNHPGEPRAPFYSLHSSRPLNVRTGFWAQFPRRTRPNINHHVLRRKNFVIWVINHSCPSGIIPTPLWHLIKVENSLFVFFGDVVNDFIP